MREAAVHPRIAKAIDQFDPAIISMANVLIYEDLDDFEDFKEETMPVEDDLDFEREDFETWLAMSDRRQPI